MRRSRLIALTSSVALAVAVVAGCSSGSDSDNAGDTGAETSAQTDGDSEGDGVDEGMSVFAPIVIEPGQTEAEASVGDALDIVVEDPASATVESDNPDIVEVFPGSDEDGVVMNPGGVALAPGTASVTVINGDGSSYVIEVTVN
jgi:hypothetical protein